jgi:predicted nuclease with TOPRIM domain
MTPERLAEIRQACDVMPWGSLPMVRELLDHIAQLEAQRGELARELDLTKREAWTAKERHKDEKDRADGLRERLDELNAEEFARAQRGGAVVVPAADVEGLKLLGECLERDAYCKGFLSNFPEAISALAFLRAQQAKGG